MGGAGTSLFHIASSLRLLRRNALSHPAGRARTAPAEPAGQREAGGEGGGACSSP